MRIHTLMLSIALIVAPAAAQADAKTGAALAEQWCASCHVISADQAPRSDGVPSFKELAARRDDKELKAFFFDPHPPMAKLPLSRAEIDDLVKYIRAQGG